jgi:hypothetical protein
MSTIEDSARQALREGKIRYQNLSAGTDNVKGKIDTLMPKQKLYPCSEKWMKV